MLAHSILRYFSVPNKVSSTSCNVVCLYTIHCIVVIFHIAVESLKLKFEQKIILSLAFRY